MPPKTNKNNNNINKNDTVEKKEDTYNGLAVKDILEWLNKTIDFDESNYDTEINPLNLADEYVGTFNELNALFINSTNSLKYASTKREQIINAIAKIQQEYKKKYTNNVFQNQEDNNKILSIKNDTVEEIIDMNANDDDDDDVPVVEVKKKSVPKKKQIVQNNNDDATDNKKKPATKKTKKN